MPAFSYTLSPMITLQNVRKKFGDAEVLRGVSFEVRPNEFVCITGPSGAGKTTLMHLLIGAETTTSGSVHVDDVDLRQVPPRALQLYRRRVGFVFQDYKLLWDRTVAENIAFPLEICGAKDSVIEKRVTEILEQMQLMQHANVLCHALSGGEKARTAIGRAIVHKPMIVLADEPTGNLDPEESMKVLKLFKDIHQRGATVILATHDTMIVDALRTRVIHLKNGVVMRDSVGKYDDREPQPSEEKDDQGKKRSVKIISTSK